MFKFTQRSKTRICCSSWGLRHIVIEYVFLYILSFQEPHKHQVEWLASALPEYSWVGKGRTPVVFGLGKLQQVGLATLKGNTANGF